MTSGAIAVGIVTWNSARHLARCLAAAGAQTHPGVEVLVVDNASSDDSLAVVRREMPRARVIVNAENRGFAAAHNQAIAATDTPYYLALNPDVIMRPDFVARLAGALDARPGFGMAGGKLVFEDGCIDSTGLFVDRRRRQWLRGHTEADRGQYDASDEVWGIDGAAPFYRRAMLVDVAHEDGQYFDELFDTYKEDVDLCWRARWRGWRALYEGTAVATHVRTFRPGTRGTGVPRTRTLSVRNRYLLMLKNDTARAWLRDLPAIAWYDAQILGYLLLRERASLAGLAGLPRLWRPIRARRRAIMARRRATEAEARAWFRSPAPRAR